MSIAVMPQHYTWACRLQPVSKLAKQRIVIVNVSPHITIWHREVRIMQLNYIPSWDCASPMGPIPIECAKHVTWTHAKGHRMLNGIEHAIKLIQLPWQCMAIIKIACMLMCVAMCTTNGFCAGFLSTKTPSICFHDNSSSNVRMTVAVPIGISREM